jgi:hypothetical protein
MFSVPNVDFYYQKLDFYPTFIIHIQISCELTVIVTCKIIYIYRRSRDCFYLVADCFEFFWPALNIFSFNFSYLIFVLYAAEHNCRRIWHRRVLSTMFIFHVWLIKAQITSSCELWTKLPIVNLRCQENILSKIEQDVFYILKRTKIKKPHAMCYLLCEFENCEESSLYTPDSRVDTFCGRPQPWAQR